MVHPDLYLCLDLSVLLPGVVGCLRGCNCCLYPHPISPSLRGYGENIETMTVYALNRPKLNEFPQIKKFPPKYPELVGFFFS